MPDGRIDIDTKIDSTGAEDGFKEIQEELAKASKEFKAAQKSLTPYKLAISQTEVAMLKLAQTSKDFTGTNQEFLQSVKELGAEHKRATETLLQHNEAAKASFIQQAAYYMNMSTQAAKISQNYERMENPLYNVNKAGLAVADTLNQAANNGQAAVLALRLLGPTANMKQLVDMQRLITQGIVRYQAVALAAAVTSAILYSSLHKAAMKSNAEYAASFQRMVSNLKKAFQPMVDVFAEIMTHVYNFINRIAEMMIAFNEAHPVLAKLIQGFLMLLPVLTLLLSPLAIGIGLFAGFQAAFASIWPLIGPLVTGLAAMSGTVLLVAAAIVGLVAGITYLWKTNEAFRNGVLNIWGEILAFIMLIVNQIRAFWEENGAEIMRATKTVWGAIWKDISFFLGLVIGLFKIIFPVAAVVVQTAWILIMTITKTLITIFLNLVRLVAALINGDWRSAFRAGQDIVRNMKDGVLNIIESLALGTVRILGKLGEQVYRALGEIAGQFSESGKKFMQSLADGIQNGVGLVTGKIEDVARKIRGFLPFSPAEEGPLKDLHRLDFGGPISVSIERAKPKIAASMDHLFRLAPYMRPERTETVPANGMNMTQHVTFNNVENEAAFKRKLLQANRALALEFQT